MPINSSKESAMYLKLFIIFLGLVSLNLGANDDIEELFGDSLEIEAESFEEIATTEELKKLFGPKSKSLGAHKGLWEIDNEDVDVDKVSFKDQSKSLIEWDKINAGTWFDFNLWRLERIAKDNNPDWKINQ